LATIKKGVDNNYVYLKKYIVQSGDNLLNICILNDLDYNANIKIIKAVNGIEDVNIIHTGQTILLPVNKKDE
ncbi:MAG: hypothetical protein K0S55_2037, partial [Clostridia bacterium]|nr:hypothetical protein [Clostridia bacterium]